MQEVIRQGCRPSLNRVHQECFRVCGTEAACFRVRRSGLRSLSSVSCGRLFRLRRGEGRGRRRGTVRGGRRSVCSLCVQNPIRFRHRRAVSPENFFPRTRPEERPGSGWRRNMRRVRFPPPPSGPAGERGRFARIRFRISARTFARAAVSTCFSIQ